jgi:hypothetical protein
MHGRVIIPFMFYWETIAWDVCLDVLELYVVAHLEEV